MIDEHLYGSKITDGVLREFGSTHLGFALRHADEEGAKRDAMEFLATLFGVNRPDMRMVCRFLRDVRSCIIPVYTFF
jgi:hypothetical protein